MSDEDPNPTGAALSTTAERERRFLELAATWKRERGPYASSTRLAENLAYQQIIALGSESCRCCSANWSGRPITGSARYRADPRPPRSSRMSGEAAGIGCGLAAHSGREQVYQW